MEAGVILVGIDFSEASAAAVERARELARACGGRVLAAHVVEREGWTWTSERREWLDEVGLNPDAVVVRVGPTWLQLVRLADEIRPTVVVVGSHGLGGFHPVGPGSTTLMLLTRVRVPVLVVPPPRFAQRGGDSNAGSSGATRSVA